MKKDYKLINILNPIGNFHTFSKYSDSLEKVFKKNCLKTFLHSLKHPTKFDEAILNERLCKKEIERYHSNRDKNQKSLLDYNYDDYLKEQKQIKKRNKKIEPWSINLSTPRLPITQKNLDFYKYNPNYNSIYKNVPSFSFVRPSKNNLILNNDIKKDDRLEKKGKNKKDEKSEQTDKNSSNLFLKTNVLHSSQTERDKFFPLLTAIDVNQTKPSKIWNKKNKLNTLYDKNNHTFRFSKYAPRKPIESKVNNRVTYLEDYDLKVPMNKTIDFQKMAKRTDKNLINAYTLKNPSMCYYTPKYDCIETRVKKIYFNPEDFKKTIKFKKNKKLKELLMSSDTNKDFITIDNSKLPTPESISQLLKLSLI